MSISLAWGICSFSRTLRVRENHTITNLDARRDRENREKSDEIRSTSEHLRDGSRKPNAKDYLKRVLLKYPSRVGLVTADPAPGLGHGLADRAYIFKLLRI